MINKYSLKLTVPSYSINRKFNQIQIYLTRKKYQIYHIYNKIIKRFNKLRINNAMLKII